MAEEGVGDFTGALSHYSSIIVRSSWDTISLGKRSLRRLVFSSKALVAGTKVVQQDCSHPSYDLEIVIIIF